MKKKGVSPLIASVLLIAFVILLFVLITTWVRRAAVEPSMQTGEEKVGSTLECAEYSLKIVEACATSGKITVDNLGNNAIPGGFTGRLVGTTTVKSGANVANILALGRSSVTISPTGLGTITKAEVYPMTSAGETCQGGLVSTTVINSAC